MSDPPDTNSPAPASPTSSATASSAGQQRRGLWRRGRLVLLILGGLGAGHWYRARTSATETAALLHGSVGQFAACVVGARPPDPMSPQATRALEAMLFRRLALSLEKSTPLADCALLAQHVRERVATHGENFYARAPAATRELSDIALRLVDLDLSQSALELAKKPDLGQPESTTQLLLRDLDRALVLSCDIAQAEKAYAVGACPLPGAPSGAASSLKSQPRIALDVSLGEPIAQFELTQGDSVGEARILVAALGRRGKVGSWVAGQVKNDQTAAWRTLAVPPQTSAESSKPPTPAPREPKSNSAPEPTAARLQLVAATSGGSWLIETSRGVSRLFALDAALTSATPRFQTQTDPGDQPAPWLGPTIIPLGSDVALVPQAALGETRLSWRDRNGIVIRTATLNGQLLALLLAPPRLLLAQQEGRETVAKSALGAPLGREFTLSVWGVSESGVTQATQLKVSDIAAPRFAAACRRQGEDLLLAASVGGGERGTDRPATAGRDEDRDWLLRVPASASQPSLRVWPAIAGEALRLGCGSCAPFVLRSVGRQLTLLDLDKQQAAEQSPGALLETPVMFAASAASSSTTACSADGGVVAYTVGGAVLAQRISKQGVASAPVEVAGPDDQGRPSAPWMISQGDRLLLFWRRVGGTTRPDRLKLEVAESLDAGLTWR